jgi:hypothetical protein
MRLARQSPLTYMTFGIIAIGLIFFAVLSFWVFYVILGNNCPPGQVRGGLGSPSGCVPYHLYPTTTPYPTSTPHAAYPAPSE